MESTEILGIICLFVILSPDLCHKKMLLESLTIPLSKRVIGEWISDVMLSILKALLDFKVSTHTEDYCKYCLLNDHISFYSTSLCSWFNLSNLDIMVN